MLSTWEKEVVFLDIKLIKVDDDMIEGNSIAWIEVIDEEIFQRLRFNKEQIEQMIKLYEKNKKIMFSDKSVKL